MLFLELIITTLIITLGQKQSAETNFKAKAKWYEHGEKSNKYFETLKINYLFYQLPSFFGKLGKLGLK